MTNDLTTKQKLTNSRVSYQVIITFDLVGAERSKYVELRQTLADELQLETKIFLSDEDGGKPKQLPYNTLAALWEKDSSEQETRNHFEKRLKKAFLQHQLKGRYVIVVAQNWSVAAGNI
jgi:hypothetical protein